MILIRYTIKEAIRLATINSYIVGHFHNGYRFIIFDNFQAFLQLKSNYKSTHELVIWLDNNHTGSYISRRDGRLCFDFDMKTYIQLSEISEWQQHVELNIAQVISILYNRIDLANIQFVWSKSLDDSKISRHLTVKGLYFEDWLVMSKQFYEYFAICWRQNYNYLDPTIFADPQIIRKNAGLRFVGSVKPDGSGLLVLENNNNYDFEDTLIRPFLRFNQTDEQCVCYGDLKIMPGDTRLSNDRIFNLCTNSSARLVSNSATTDKNYLAAFILKSKNTHNNITYYYYKRTYPSHCPICQRTHDNDNAYVKISDNKITFHCYRNSDKCLSVDNQIEFNIDQATNNNIIDTNDKIVSTVNNKILIIDYPQNISIIL